MIRYWWILEYILSHLFKNEIVVNIIQFFNFYRTWLTQMFKTFNTYKIHTKQIKRYTLVKLDVSFIIPSLLR